MKCTLRCLQSCPGAAPSYTASPFLEIFRCGAGHLGCICYHVHVLALLQAREQHPEGVRFLIFVPSLCDHTEHHEQSVQMSLIKCTIALL